VARVAQALRGKQVADARSGLGFDGSNAGILLEPRAQTLQATGQTTGEVVILERSRGSHAQLEARPQQQ